MFKFNEAKTFQTEAYLPQFSLNCINGPTLQILFNLSVIDAMDLDDL